MTPVSTPKGPSTVVGNQGTLEMVTTVQVVVVVIPVSLSASFDTTTLVKKNIACFFGAEFLKVHLFYHNVNRTWTHLHS